MKNKKNIVLNIIKKNNIKSKSKKSEIIINIIIIILEIIQINFQEL